MELLRGYQQGLRMMQAMQTQNQPFRGTPGQQPDTQLVNDFIRGFQQGTDLRDMINRLQPNQA